MYLKKKWSAHFLIPTEVSEWVGFNTAMNVNKIILIMFAHWFLTLFKRCFLSSAGKVFSFPNQSQKAENSLNMYNIYAWWCMMIKNLLTYLISGNLRSVMNEPAVILTLLNLLIFWVQVQLTFGRTEQ